MKYFIFVFLLIVVIGMDSSGQVYNQLTEEESRVIDDKGTERAFTGEYYKTTAEGVYVCRKCNSPLYISLDKFQSDCGWPSFDDEIEGAVTRQLDIDGRRTEIICSNCKGHLGHLFTGEGLTDKNVRHCVNSISMKFIPKGESVDDMIEESSMEIAYLASGCFWGTEFHLQKIDGVVKTTVGYTGGHKVDPTYKQVCTGTTGHAEVVKVEFDSSKVSYEEILKVYFETHDPSQIDGQGPDIGTQYRSEIFTTTEDQIDVAESVIDQLEAKGYSVVTKITTASTFYSAEAYHQDYYENKGTSPYCHIYKKKF